MVHSGRLEGFGKLLLSCPHHIVSKLLVVSFFLEGIKSLERMESC